MYETPQKVLTEGSSQEGVCEEIKGGERENMKTVFPKSL
jgi:hypothetical protein